MHDLISSTQSVFIFGRLISEIIMIAYEVLHTMQTRNKGEKESMT